MGADYYAETWIGIPIEPTDLFVSRQVSKRACSHDVPSKAKYCPECGKPNQTVETEERAWAYWVVGDLSAAYLDEIDSDTFGVMLSVAEDLMALGGFRLHVLGDCSIPYLLGANLARVDMYGDVQHIDPDVISPLMSRLMGLSSKCRLKKPVMFTTLHCSY